MREMSHDHEKVRGCVFVSTVFVLFTEVCVYLYMRRCVSVYMWVLCTCM